VGWISWVVKSLTKLSPGTAKSVPEEAVPIDLEISEESVIRFIHAWRERTSYLPSELLSDPAWDMLLELLHAEIQDRRVSLARLCNVSAISTRSAVRWLNALQARELVLRRADPDGAQKELVELSQKGSSALRRYFHDVVQGQAST
jgi:DNA-binding MarR family transcriptional regulator